MSVIFIVLPLALLVVAAAVVAYLWAVRAGQFDDLTTPAIRALHEDPAPRVSAPEARMDPPTDGSRALSTPSTREPRAPAV